MGNQKPASHFLDEFYQSNVPLVMDGLDIFLELNRKDIHLNAAWF